VDGIAYVLPYTASLAGKRTHRVYLKNMLLSETAENLLPDWAFFVKAVVNANDLRPTASRESFYEDDKLTAARDALGDCLREYLLGLRQKDPQKLDRLLALHALAIKALATQDDDFYRMVIDWLPFETSQGEMTFGDFRRMNEVVRYVPTVDQFRQVARVAQAHGLAVVNAGYTYDAELLARAEDLLDLPVEQLDPGDLSHSFDELTLAEQERTAPFMTAAEVVLTPFNCEPEIKRYKPKELPALYTTTSEGRFFRSLEQSKEIASPLWSGVLDNMAKKERPPSRFGNLCFNLENPLVRRLTTVRDRSVLHRSIQMLYLQSMLLGHHPLNRKEMQLLNDGLLALIEWGIGLQGGPEK
jgi:molecular chaperone HtpG